MVEFINIKEAGRLFDFAHWEALQAELSPVPRLKHAAMDDGRILQKRLAQEVTVMIHSQEEYEKGGGATLFFIVRIEVTLPIFLSFPFIFFVRDLHGSP